MTVGVLALQGAFREHAAVLRGLGIPVRDIRRREDLQGIRGIVLPGGESTVQGKLLRDFGILEPLRDLIAQGLPVMGTCAGLILLAREIGEDGERHLGTLPVRVFRNIYGRQLGSFVTNGRVGEFENFREVFIRAPGIAEILDPETEVLAVTNGRITGVRYRNQFGFAFHPELTANPGLHLLFLKHSGLYPEPELPANVRQSA
ncbi:pyridoxal 5'-phosphate synthase glutaminase subunit PdxT [Succinimonas amylolytica]|uniref:pyridoxal 5'-phosphate synthase glutaminase subunit PdxT n=1 Tax=Succinimonas amylolytica TaxID=83769 RepID=UPI0003686665|nr:pyridoxal 5'-phosphate synthase glutaminase subunit PdxT [Succinimonas amylolytica]